MAHITTPNHRPQMATVRYKVMNAPERMEEEQGEIVECSIEKGKLKTNVEVLDIVLKEKEKFIESADVLVVAGRGVKKEGILDAGRIGRPSWRAGGMYKACGRERLAGRKTAGRLKRPVPSGRN